MTQWEKFAAQVNQFETRGKGPAPYRIIGDRVSIKKCAAREFIGRVPGHLLSQQMNAFAEIAGKPDDVRTFAAAASG